MILFQVVYSSCKAMLMFPFAYVAYRFMLHNTSDSPTHTGSYSKKSVLGEGLSLVIGLIVGVILLDMVLLKITPLVTSHWLVKVFYLLQYLVLSLTMFFACKTWQIIAGGARHRLRCFAVAAFVALLYGGITMIFVVKPGMINGISPIARDQIPTRMGSPSVPHVGLYSRLGYYVLRPMRGAVVSILNESAGHILDTWQREIPTKFHFTEKLFGFTASYVGRVVGMPGETVVIENGTVSIDGVMLDEPYLQNMIYRGEKVSIRLDDTDYLIAEDIREDSAPNVFFVVHQNQVQYRQLFIIMPLKSFGFVQPPSYKLITNSNAWGLRINHKWIERLVKM